MRAAALAIIAAVLLLAFAPSVRAAKQTYTIATALPYIDVTRTTLRDPAKDVLWVNVYCHDATHATVYDTELPVAWIGYEGSAGPFSPSGHCWAQTSTHLTYQAKGQHPTLYFVAP